MKFWKKIFKDAMWKFKATPGLKDPERSQKYDIRKADNWDDIHRKLVAAREHYTNTIGIGGHIRQFGRWLAGNATEVVSVGLAVSPKPAIATPVFAAVGIIVDAVKTGAATRKEVLGGLEGLDAIFYDLELFLSTFEGEGDIMDKAIGLIANVFLAVERGIGFFIRPGLLKGVKTVVQGKNYEEPLLDSLKKITGDSKTLMALAVKFHIRDFQRFSIETRNINQLIRSGQEQLATRVGIISTKIVEFEDQINDFNKNMRDSHSIIEMLADGHEKEKTRLLKEIERERAEKEKERSANRIERDARLALERRAARLECENRTLRSVSPSFQQSAWALPPPPPPVPFLDQPTLWRLLDMNDIDTADMEYIEQQGSLMDATDRSQTEQIVLNHRFQDWVVSARSARLLVHGDFHGLVMQTSALSLLCTTLARAFRLRERFLCLVWFCGRHLSTGSGRSGSEHSGGGSDWSGDGSDSDSHYGYDYDADYLGSDDGEDDDDDVHHDLEEPYAHNTRTRVIKRMLRSLIAQLLCDYDFGAATNLLPPGGAPELVACANLHQLRAVFAWLVRLLPADITLFCLVDGIIFYERDEYEGPMLDVLGDILGLAADKNLATSLKVLVTSPFPTSIVRVGFEADEEQQEGEDGGGAPSDFILPLALLEPGLFEPSQERTKRELSGEAGDNDDGGNVDDEEDENDGYDDDGGGGSGNLD
ncbi:hypothetical protein GQ53DRAFT_700911 [Thozetella sp. PMI_491]|nr:hypothetical protein GQ53DRAFT_700911 [Thozetella sp. PMI_491]